MSRSSVKLTLPARGIGKPLSIRCASQRYYAVAQIVPDVTAGARLEVTFRSDSPKHVAEHVRRHPHYHYIYDLSDGELLWHNTSSEWISAEQAVTARHIVRER